MILSKNNVISSLPKNAKRSGTIMSNTGTDETRNDILSSAKKLFFTKVLTYLNRYAIIAVYLIRYIHTKHK